MKKRSCRCTFLCLCLLLPCSCKASSTTQTSSCELHYIDKKIKSFIKHFYALKEPSSHLTNMTQELLQNSSLQDSLVILETSRPARSWNAFAMGGVSCTFMILPPVPHNYQRSSAELFAFYHELGHVYYNHSAKRRIASLALVATAFLTYLTSAKFFKKNIFQQIISLVATGYLTNSLLDYTIDQEIEADLFACKRLKEEDKAFVIKDQIELANSYLSYRKNTTRIVPTTPTEKIIKLTHPDWQQRANYLLACLDE